MQNIPTPLSNIARLSALLLLLVMSLSSLSAQQTLAIGQWDTHLPFNTGSLVCQSDEFVYYATEFSLLKINKSDLSYEKINKHNGLSESLIKTIYYHKESKTLIVAYTTGIIDLINGEGIFTVTDLANFNNIPINKNINSISDAGNEHVFINGDYGLSRLNVVTGRFEYSVFVESNHFIKTVKFDNKLFAATTEGLYVYDEKANALVQDFGSWQNLSEASIGLAVGQSIDQIEVFNGNLYVSSGPDLYFMNNMHRFELKEEFNGFKIQYLDAYPEEMLVGLGCSSQNCDHSIKILNPSGVWSQIANECTQKNIRAIKSNNGWYWLSDERWGFRYMKSATDQCNVILVNGPLTNRSFEILPASDAVYVASGGFNEIGTYQYYSEGLLKFKDRSWDAINQYSVPFLDSIKLLDVVRIVESPDKTKLFIASNQQGLIEYDKISQKYKIYNSSNSALEVPPADPSRLRITGLSFDKAENLWVSLFLSPHPLVCFKKDGSSQAFDLKGMTNLLFEVKVDHNGYKWIVPKDAIGVIVFDEKNPDDPTDDRAILVNSSNSEIQNNRVNTVEVDLEGDVWVGTAQGPIVFECSSSIFDGKCRGTRKKYVQDGIPYYLLESEVISSIAFDGGNRKWFGTTNGLYVLSPSTDEEIHIFNASNSPLLDNTIIDVAIDGKTGEAWIATDRGLQVFRSDATSALDNSFGQALVFPNPVPSNYSGIIAINGLSRDARVKITDISGRLVYESLATGGQFNWNGNDYLGHRSATGVYLVWANTTQNLDKSYALMTKIIFNQ